MKEWERWDDLQLGGPGIYQDKRQFCFGIDAVLLADFVMITAEAILLSFAGRYLKAEQADGTPFTVTGAETLKKLGIRCIWLPIVAMVVASVIGVSFGVEDLNIGSNLPSLATGIVLILASMIFRYGAALEETCKC